MRSFLLLSMLLPSLAVASEPLVVRSCGYLPVGPTFDDWTLEEEEDAAAPPMLLKRESKAAAPAASSAGGGRGFGATRPRPRPAPRPSVLPPPAEEWTPSPGPRTSSPGEPSFAFGGSTWLSNDDSMSLASAQRMLWAAKSGRELSPAEIRPHELLNYFTFDTAQPDGGATFEVTASAETHGDQLSVAFAVQGATPPRQALDLTLVLDRSGSMDSEGRMSYVKRGLRKMTEQLHRGDRLDIVLFDDVACTPIENFVVGRDDPDLLDRAIQGIAPRGSTDLDGGLREGYAVAKRKTGTHRRNRRIMLLTDAQMNRGTVDPHVVSAIGRTFDEEGIRLTGVGVGRDFNDEALDRLTEKGKGAYVYLGSEAVVDRVFGPGFDGLVQTLAHDVRFRLDLPDSLALKRFYGEEASTDMEDIQPIHYYAGTSQVFLQDLKMKSTRPPLDEQVALEVAWRDARTGEPEKRVFRTTVRQMLQAPHNVRKGRALMAFSDLLLASSMGSCGSALETFEGRAAQVGDDAEIAYVRGLAEGRCKPVTSEWSRPHVEHGLVDLKIKVDADVAIGEVRAVCSSGRTSDTLSAGDQIARFRVAPGRCKLILDGVVPMTTSIDVPEVSSTVRCLVRGGRLSCS